MSLHKYRSKRQFDKSPEPAGGGKAPPSKPLFVIQEHDASNLHYDFRLQIGNHLKSWAVPKGLSTDPREKRLAIETEDHPLEYADFEGVIPEGSYGAGTVLIWDRGYFRNLRDSDMEKDFRSGLLEIWLEGKKLSGGYALKHFRTEGNQRQWLLVKMRDSEADARRNPVSTQPESVVSGRKLKEIAGDKA